MTRPLSLIENEIIMQINICEVCFKICDSIIPVTKSGRDFIPFYYNLVFTRGLNGLHSLLLSQLKNELSIRNYIKMYKSKHPTKDFTLLEAQVAEIAKTFEESFPMPLRHKVSAHLDINFEHTGFIDSYLEPSLVKKYSEIINKLKVTIFKFANYSLNQNVLGKIKNQSDKILEFYSQTVIK